MPRCRRCCIRHCGCGSCCGSSIAQGWSQQGTRRGGSVGPMANAVGAAGCDSVVGNFSHLLTFLMTLQAEALKSQPEGVAKVSFDPKTYVDLALRQPLRDTEVAFAALPRAADGGIDNATLQAFVQGFFDPPGFELEQAESGDFVPEPPNFLPRVQSKEVRAWALQIHAIWSNLTRRIKPEVFLNLDRHTLLPLRGSFVVPGSRFREVYYWDSYWVLRGLIVSRMLKAARSLVDNLLSLVDSIGFVPNGARTYYTNRSQPPMLSEMVACLFRATGDMEILRRALPTLIVEHRRWSSKLHRVLIRGRDGTLHSLSRYYALWNKPRPESATLDEVVAHNVSEERREQLYRDIATAAETGWDFSSRWMADGFNLSTLRTSLIVPVDLNALLYQMEDNIRSFAQFVGDEAVEAEFKHLAARRAAAIHAVFWSEQRMQWFDYWLPPEVCPGEEVHQFDVQRQNQLVFASNFVPVWCGLIPHTDEGRRQDDGVTQALLQSGLVLPAGIATSLRNTGQQWDFPNGWAPLQHMIIEGMGTSRNRSTRAVARELARRWLQTNHEAFVVSGAMHEKYDVRQCGFAGGGGEYAGQTGFGWTNGVVLSLLERFGWPPEIALSCDSTPRTVTPD